MLGWIIAGTIGVLGYNAFKNEQVEKQSFHNISREYPYYGIMYLWRSNEGNILVYVDDMIFCRIRKGMSKDIFRVADFPIGAKLTQILEKPDGSKEVLMETTITENMVQEKYKYRLNNEFNHGLWL